MNTMEKKEILEIEKLKLEVRNLLQHSNKLFILKFYTAMLATVAVTATITKYLSN
jgi:hypothetical protein